MFKNKKRIRAAWLKGLMFGRALGAKQERERIIELLEAYCEDRHDDKCHCPNQISLLLTGKEVENV